MSRAQVLLCRRDRWAKGMSAELIGILGVGAALLSVGVALGALTLARKRNTMQRLADMVRWLATSAARRTPRGCPGAAMCKQVCETLVVSYRARLPEWLGRQPVVDASRAGVAPAQVRHAWVEQLSDRPLRSTPAMSAPAHVRPPGKQRRGVAGAP